MMPMPTVNLKHLLLLFALALGFTSCTKDEDPVIPTEPRDRWEKIELPETDVNVLAYFGVEFVKDSVFVVKRVGSKILFWCKTPMGAWQTTEITGTSYMDPTFMNQDTDGTLWVLTGLNLTHITGCGQVESFDLSSADSLYQLFNDELKFVGFQGNNGIPWFLHRKWGLFHFDVPTGVLVHHPIVPYYYPSVAEVGYFDSFAVDNFVVFANEDGRLWYFIDQSQWGFPIESWDTPCRYHNLRVSPQLLIFADVSCNGDSATLQTYPGGAVSTLPTQSAPHYFTLSKLDGNSRLAYWSSYPFYQPVIGLQNTNGTTTTVNAQHAVEQGNVIVHQIAFGPGNTLYACTDRGLFKYLGK